MTISRRPGRRTTLAVVAAALLTLASGCGSASKPAASAGGAPVAAAAAGSASASIPVQDVVSAVRPDPALKAELPAAIAARGTLSLGTTRPTGLAGLPHDGVDAAGREVGLDVDLRNAIAAKLGISWQAQYGTFATIIPGAQNGRFDVGWGNFGVTKAREQVVDFATYLTDGQAFLGAAGVKTAAIGTLSDLCGYTVATSPGSTFQQILTDGAAKCAAAGKPAYRVQYFADSAPIFLGLANGKIDIMFGPTLSLRYDAAHVPGTKFLGQISTTPVGVVVAKGSPLAKPISDAVNALIADGSYTKIFTKWGVPDTAIPASQINPAPTL